MQTNGKSLGTLITELRQMSVTYIREQATAPLKGAFRFLRLGLLGGAIAVAGGILVSLGLLRVAQSVTVLDIDHGGWSWLVYLAVGIVCLLAGALFVVTGARSRT